MRFQTQIKVIAVFYVFSSFADWFYYSVGKRDLQHGNIECLNTSFLIPRNNQGSIIFIVYTLFTYCYSLIVLYVFYVIPKKSGFALDIRGGERPLTETNDNENVLGIHSTMQEHEAREFIRAVQRGDDFLKHKLSPGKSTDDSGTKRSISQVWL